MKFSTAIFSLVVPTLSFVSVAQDDPQSGDRVMIQATIESYVDAFNEHDAEKLASTWTEECNYVDMTGRMVEGRDTILGEYKDYFRMNPEATMQIHLLSMNMASEDVAIEDGIREIVVAPGSEPNNIRYTAIHVRDGDRWLVKSVRDAVAFEQTNYQYLRGLEWLVGEWSDEGTDGVTMNSSCNWSQNRNFLIGNFSSFSGDKMIISGTQWIGWDPINKRIHSWLFDSNGGFGEGVWTRDGNKWTIDSTTVLPSGKTVRENHILTFVGADQMTFESVDRTIDGDPLPNVKEVVSYRAQQDSAGAAPDGQ